MYGYATLAGLMLSTSMASASSMFVKRDSWGPAFSLGPAKKEIISTTTTVYPGSYPADQGGYLFVWLGISNGTGDLIQSIIGSYPSGQSECSGTAADSTWCISSEVYGLASNGYPNQWVGDLTTADVNYDNGIKLNYTLIDKDSYLWLQTMEDAVTGQLLSTFNKTSGPMLGWGTALECDDYNSVACTGTSTEQYYVNSTIILESADETFVDTLGMSTGVTGDMVTADGGKTWTIAKIVIPAMEAAASSSSTTAAAVSTVAAQLVFSSSNPIVAETSVTETSSADPVIKSSAPKVSSGVVSPAVTTPPVASSAQASAASTSTKTKRHGHQGHSNRRGSSRRWAA